MERGVCVCVCAHVLARCAGQGLRGAGKMHESTHTHLVPTHLPASGVQARGRVGREPITSRLPPKLLPLVLGSGKEEKKGYSEGGRSSAEMHPRDHKGSTEAGSQPGLVGAEGPGEVRAALRWGRAWDRSGLASPYLDCVGAFCSGSGAGWAPPPRGRDCSAVTSGSARRWTQSPELANLPCPESAEVAWATRAPQPAYRWG